MKPTTALHILTTLFCVVASAVASSRNCESNAVFRSDGDIRLTFFVNECDSTERTNTINLISVWVCERLNILEYLGNLRLGLTVYDICEDQDYLDPLLDVTQAEDYSLGIVAWNPLPKKIQSIAQILNIPITHVPKQWKTLVLASIGLLKILRWDENVTIATENSEILDYFFHESRKEWVCVNTVRTLSELSQESSNNPIVMIGSGHDLSASLENVLEDLNSRIILVPTDGAQVKALREGCFIILPTFADNQQKISPHPKIIPGPILLDLAVPVINIARNVSSLLWKHCNETFREIPCLKRLFETFPATDIAPVHQQEVLNYLKITPLQDKFVYNVYKVETIDSVRANETETLQTLVRVGAYDMFNFTLRVHNAYLADANRSAPEGGCAADHRRCSELCGNFRPAQPAAQPAPQLLALRQEPWTLAVLALAGLGELFCAAVLAFIAVRLCKRDVLEGSPALSVLLLLALAAMYAAVVPFALDAADPGPAAERLCLARALPLTLSYCCAFSLMLSRCVMLATAAHEAGFLSHVPGHVQALLCLLMVAVQGALSVQVARDCRALLLADSPDALLLLLGYDALLLALLLCCGPLVFRSQRNYREGKYFAAAALLVALVWAAWGAALVLAGPQWRAAALCAGLLGTASAILGAVFIPRTYLMTGAVVRDSLTSALPSLAFASTTSVLDLNYGNQQHIYDCVNPAAVGAGGAAQPCSQPPQPCNPNLYSGEPAPGTEPCDSPRRSPDKVTRF